MSHGTRTGPAHAAGTCQAGQHGTPAAYDWWGCRCPEAREAWRIYRKRLRHNRQPPANVPALGTARRLQALVALGHSWTDLAPNLDVSIARVRQIAMNADGMVHRTNAARVGELYERLSGTPGSTRYAFIVAARNGWLPPLAWDDIDDPAEVPAVGESDGDLVDEVAVERALAGDRVDLTDAELVVVFQAGTARGESLSKLSSRLGVNYWGARKMLGGELTPRRDKQSRIEAEILRSSAGDYVIAVQLGVQRSTVSRARARLRESGRLGVAS